MLHLRQIVDECFYSWPMHLRIENKKEIKKEGQRIRWIIGKTENKIDMRERRVR